jgi:hypothetical protein
MSDTDTAAETVEEPQAEVAEEAPAEDAPAAEEPEAAEEPQAEAVEAPEAHDGPDDADGGPEADSVDEAAIAAAEEELAEEAIPQALGPVAGRQAKVYLCERGHRTVAVWSNPTACHARPTRSSECGRPLYPIGELPEQVQKALNPLKASKKASKG